MLVVLFCLISKIKCHSTFCFYSLNILFHSEIGCECCFMLTFTFHRLVTMWHNYTKHKSLQLFILFYQTGYERSQISQCSLGSCCFTDVNAKQNEGKHHLKRRKHVIHRANIISKKKGGERISYC